MSDKKLSLPYLATIPYIVLIDKDVEPAAKIYYGCLVGLAKNCGYCYATDEQLSQMHDVTPRTIKRWNVALEDKGFIFRETKNIPFRDENQKLLWKKKRKIFVGDPFSQTVRHPQSKKLCEGDKNVPFNEGDKNVTSDEGDKNVPYNSKPSKKKPNNNNESVVVPFSDKTSELLDQIQFDPGFRARIHKMKNKKEGRYVTENEILNAANFTMNIDSPTPEALFTDVLNNPKKYKIKTTQGERENNNKKIAEDFQSRIKQIPKEANVNVLGKYIEITFASHCDTVSYDEIKFEEKIVNMFRKWKIQLKPKE